MALLSLTERKCLLVASCHSSPVECVRWRLVEDFLLVSCVDGKLYVWQIETGERVEWWSGGVVEWWRGGGMEGEGWSGGVRGMEGWRGKVVEWWSGEGRSGGGVEWWSGGRVEW